MPAQASATREPAVPAGPDRGAAERSGAWRAIAAPSLAQLPAAHAGPAPSAGARTAHGRGARRYVAGTLTEAASSILASLRRRPVLSAALIYAIVVVVFLGPALLPGKTLSSSDTLRFRRRG